MNKAVSFDIGVITVLDSLIEATQQRREEEERNQISNTCGCACTTVAFPYRFPPSSPPSQRQVS